MPLKDDSIKILKYMLLLYMLFYILEKGTALHEPSAGWSGGAKVLGKLSVPGRPTIWIAVGQGPTALAVGAGGCFLDIFTLIYPFFPLSPSLWETARYRLKYCLKGPLNSKQPTNQLHEPSVLHNLLHVLLRRRKSKVSSRILSIFLEVIRA